MQKFCTPVQRGLQAAKCIAKAAGIAMTAKHAKFHAAARMVRADIEKVYPSAGVGRTKVQHQDAATIRNSRAMKSRFTGTLQMPFHWRKTMTSTNHDHTTASCHDNTEGFRTGT